MKEKEGKYLRVDLQEIHVNQTAYYRLTEELVRFLNLLEKNGEEIVGIELTRKEDGSFDFNIGFVVANLED